MPTSRKNPWETFSAIRFWLHISTIFGVTALVPRTSSRSVKRSLKMVFYSFVFNIGYFCAAFCLPEPFRSSPDIGYILNFSNVVAYVVTGRGSSVVCLLMTTRMNRFLNRVLKNALKFPRLIHSMSTAYLVVCIIWRLTYYILRMMNYPSYYIIVSAVVYIESLTISVVAALFVMCQVLLFCCFRELNKKLTQLFHQSKNSIFNILSPKKEVVRNLRRLHDELCDAAEDLDLVQGPAALLIAAFNFILMTSALYQEAKHQLTIETTILRAWGFIKILWHLLTLTILIWCNTITAHKGIIVKVIRAIAIIPDGSKQLGFQQIYADDTVDLVHSMMYETRDPMIKKELKIFSLQLLHRKIRFTACGFFPLDFTLLYSMLGAITAYLVILIQFQQGYEERAKGQNFTSSGRIIGDLTTY